ncbi:uncharacterized protein BX664DRAFT_356962 [Halteromyces radiatus]|uniref:uncharacterized protein n=1 Tax=Halteromyces radiatus TaxID=101107 RepID=UPI0022209331|nr:uncharacterized protein BX664DRAFT_356962 [Halteromyces radiatus]KAI8097752.1 hypothetical protein BX664DRAFT_356962 [Halteromyces radiatus]
MSDEKISKEIMALETKEAEIAKKVQDYHRKLMTPIWDERRELVKQIPNFWSEVISNSTLFRMQPSDDDLEALENLTDFNVEYDDANPDYRKVVATFKKNGIFKNETLTKEFTVDEEDVKVISKSTIEYHEGKEPSKKRKAEEEEEEDEDFLVGFVRWFGDETIPYGVALTEDVFPAALEYYRGNESDDDEDDEDIELGSDSEEDEEEEAPKSKKSKK